MDGRKHSADAEARWSAAEARYARGFVVAALVIAAGIVSTLVFAKLEVRPLAIGCSVVTLAAMAWTIGLIVGRQWKLLGAYGAAAILAALPLSITSNRLAAPRWHFDVSDRLSTLPAQFLDDPRWIAMLAAVLTVSGPWLPARWRHWWWGLLLAFVPIHLVISAIVPAHMRIPSSGACR